MTPAGGERYKMDDIDLTLDKLYHIHTGLVFMAVCAPATWDAERVKAEANVLAGSPGTSAGEWIIAENVTSGLLENSGLESNPFPCQADSNRRHWVLNC